MDHFRCPHCQNMIVARPAGPVLSHVEGPLLSRVKGAGRLFESRANSPFHQTTPAPRRPKPPPGSRATRETPTGPPTGETINVRLSEALISGAIIGLIAGPASLAVTYWLDFETWPMIGTCFAIGAAGLIGGLAYTWFGRSGHYDALLWRVEEFTGFDLTGDGDVGQPSPPVQLEITQRDQKGQLIKQYLPELPAKITLEMFADWCEAVAGGYPISEDRWIGPDSQWDKTPYRDMLKMLARVGAIKKDGRARNAPWIVAPGKFHDLGRWATIIRKSQEEN